MLAIGLSGNITIKIMMLLLISAFIQLSDHIV